MASSASSNKPSWLDIASRNTPKPASRPAAAPSSSSRRPSPAPWSAPSPAPSPAPSSGPSSAPWSAGSSTGSSVALSPTSTSSSPSSPSSSSSSSSPAPEVKFIRVKANMSGDMWHVAGICALWPLCIAKSEASGGSFAFAGWKPRPAIIWWNSANSDILKEVNKHGTNSYNYFKSIGLEPIVVVVAPKPSKDPAKDKRDPDENQLSHNYLSMVATAFDQRKPSSWTEALDEAEKCLPNAPPHGRIKGGPDTDPGMIPLQATTALLMQIIDYLGVTRALRGLGDGLSAGLLDKDRQDAENVFTALKDMITQVQRSNRFDRVVLLNYRRGDVNTQHNTTENIKIAVKNLGAQARPKTLVFSIPQMSPDTWTKNTNNFLKSRDETPMATKDYILDLYGLLDPNGAVLPRDQRGKVWFWKRVAEDLQINSRVASTSTNRRGLVGMIGGRSGSMDLPSFLGVRCMSWDEQFFLGAKTSPPKYLQMQGSQYLRVLNQWPLMSMAYLQGKNLNLTDTRVSDWLAMNPPPAENWEKAVQALPPSNTLLNPVQSDCAAILKVFDEFVKDYGGKMQRPDIGIEATHLKALSEILGMQDPDASFRANY